MKVKVPTLLFVVMLITSAVLLVASDEIGSTGPEIHNAHSSSPRGTDWSLVDQQQFEFQIDPQNHFVISQNTSTSLLESSQSFDVYSTLNVTAQKAVDRCPQWLNLTLSWKFAELSEADQVTYGDLLLNSSMNESYLDEIGFTLSYMPKEILSSSAFDPFCLWENVDTMYNISRELKYADIVDTQKTDGEHSTVRYAIPGSNITLPEEIYYWYVATPRSNIELPAYINYTLVETTDNPNLYYTDHNSGVWWRTWLYNTSHHASFPVLRDLLLNETVLWKSKQNNIDDNGAVGAVSKWQRDLMPFFGVNGTRSHQPVAHYIHRWGMCGENSDMLAAVAKIALIPCVPTLNLEAWHGWNEFFERGWHQWEAYSAAVDFPPNEGAYGATSVHTSFNPDSSQMSATEVYTGIANLTVNVVDNNGIPIDGALVNLATAPTYNNPSNIGIIGNATDARGNAGFKVGFSHDYYVHAYSPYGQFPTSAGSLVKAAANTTLGGNYTYNVTIGGSITTQSLVPKYSDEEDFGTRYNITVEDVIQPTRMYSDPFGYGHSAWKDWPNGSRLMVLILDDTNLDNYEQDLPFTVTRILHIDEGNWGITTVPADAHYNIVITGRYQPLSKTRARVNVTIEEFSGTPKAVILRPHPGTYILGSQLNFSGKITPTIPAMGPFMFQWESNLTGVLASSQTFTWEVQLGWHNITMTVSNGSGPISGDWVHIRIKHPNRAPSANISLPVDGSVYEYGEPIPFSANGSRDPDRDNLSYSWYEPSLDFELSTSKVFQYMLVEGEYMVILTVSDPYGLNDTALVNFTVLPENKPPIPNIDSPEDYDVFFNTTAILFSAQGTWDEAPLVLDYTWNSSKDGIILKGFYGYVQLTPGNHTVTLWVDDGKHNISTSISIKVVAKVTIIDLPPVAVIEAPESEMIFYVNEPVIFDSNGSYDPEGKSLVFRWWLDELVESDSASFEKMLPEGEYTVKLEVFDGMHWASSEEVTFSVVDRLPVISIIHNGSEIGPMDPLTIYLNETLILDASGSYDPEGTNLTFLWYVNDDSVSAFPTVSLDLDVGNYAILLEVTDGTGTTSFRTVWVTVLKKNITVEPPPVDDDIEDDDDDDDKDEKGFLSENLWLILLLLLAVALAIMIVFVVLRTKKVEEEIEDEDWDEEDLDDFDEEELDEEDWEE
jgi:hypothetical protein